MLAFGWFLTDGGTHTEWTPDMCGDCKKIMERVLPPLNNSYITILTFIIIAIVDCYCVGGSTQITEDSLKRYGVWGTTLTSVQKDGVVVEE